jgi:L-2,4-diaminobutyric acid acetyltransferase
MSVKTRLPHIDDSPAIYELIRSSPPLDLNSRYLYMLLTTHFRKTCIIAELTSENGQGDPQLAGFLSGYRLPEEPEVFFVWQVAVSSVARGKGVAKTLLLDVLKRPALNDLKQIITTVTPSNTASLKLFESVARHLDTKIVEEKGFEANLFGGDAHEPEMLYRIGPFNLTTTKD